MYNSPCLKLFSSKSKNYDYSKIHIGAAGIKERLFVCLPVAEEGHTE